MFKKKEKTFYKRFKNFLINLFIVGIVIVFAFNYTKSNFAINRSSSLKTGIYKLYPLENLKRGDIVTFTVSDELYNFMLERGYIDKYTKGFIKKIGAIEGDIVEVRESLFINGKFIKKLYKDDSFSKPLPLKIRKYILKKDEFFMIGEHERSFDSSYMGIVRKEQLGKKARLIYEF